MIFFDQSQAVRDLRKYWQQRGYWFESFCVHLNYFLTRQLGAAKTFWSEQNPYDNQIPVRKKTRGTKTTDDTIRSLNRPYHLLLNRVGRKTGGTVGVSQTEHRARQTGVAIKVIPHIAQRYFSNGQRAKSIIHESLRLSTSTQTYLNPSLTDSSSNSCSSRSCFSCRIRIRSPRSSMNRSFSATI